MTPDPETGIAPDGFRLPATARPGTVTLQVSDLDRSLAFYRDIIGFRVLDRTDSELHLGAAATATREAGSPDAGSPEAGGPPLMVLRERPGARRVAPRSRLGLFHSAVLLPSRSDFGRFLRHVSGLGVQLGASDHSVSEALYLMDPDGLNLEVYRDRPRSEWRTRGRELAMTTEPLDTAGAMAAGGEGDWGGLPSGTRIGHMHLHVGNLDEAADFYHQGLGFDKVVWSYPGALFMSAGGYHHHLGVNTWARSAPPAAEDEARLLEWTLRVPDAAALAAAAESLADRGFATLEIDGGLRAVDPWGTAVRLVATR